MLGEDLLHGVEHFLLFGDVGGERSLEVEVVADLLVVLVLVEQVQLQLSEHDALLVLVERRVEDREEEVLALRSRAVCRMQPEVDARVAPHHRVHRQRDHLAVWSLAVFVHQTAPAVPRVEHRCAHARHGVRQVPLFVFPHPRDWDPELCKPLLHLRQRVDAAI
eukprot:1861208-Rhodomonas_salina.2